ncbi:hypothetical protein GYM69_03940 [Lactobacillus panisapium]|uniref:hypothetical protein n=1 Tax=Lactobacillus panisapium TaxID=2012495 RepID=UPI001C695DEE|nr:hypothetical protein [Lactobacillus panisapium]QYN56332.1 hypothetical protein GYM69_03940 [Lactobacillus panisapium]
MKLRKIITVLLATVTLTTVSGLLTSQPEMVQAKQTKIKIKKTKNGFTANFNFPQSWRGKWYSYTNQKLKSMEIHSEGLNTPWTGEYVKLVTPTKVKGTNKYIWQMGHKWNQKYYPVIKKVSRVSTKTLNKQKWIIMSPIDEKSLKMGYAFALETRQLDGTNQEIMFEANPITGQIYEQFFRSPELAQKYSGYRFNDLNYLSYDVN